MSTKADWEWELERINQLIGDDLQKTDNRDIWMADYNKGSEDGYADGYVAGYDTREAEEEEYEG